MSYNLRNRSFLAIKDFSPQEIKFLLKLSKDLKSAKYAGIEQQRLKRKNIALIFEKNSTRTRVGFEVAAYDQGANVTFLGPTGSHIGHKETIKDTARVLGRIYDGIEYRGFGQDIVEQIAKYSGVPVFNGLTNEYHPTQFLADALTMIEHSEKPIDQITYCFIGDAENNMGNALLIGGAKLGMDVRLCAPKACWPNSEIIEYAQSVALETGAKLQITEEINVAVKDCDFIYTDVWVSMGEDEEKWQERINLLKPYQVNTQLMKQTGNLKTKFMHCLPSFHNTDTTMGIQIKEKFGLDCMEVTDEVFESKASIVFDQAENRMHTIKAVLVATMGD
ncbi:ornithine carbamoyltransferase [Poseidonibacter antarcticus]|uniref:ornithine carbamoyltransferase n=1 Tax=Poseidonibacter antarcticus TaxID=2478538 RepID=UPI000EF48688|nr:ornithine carbamoyltransferase [Poseidonibacter antarcticus]